MNSGKIFSLSLSLAVFLFSCAGKKELVKELRNGSYVIDEFYRGGKDRGVSLSKNYLEKAVEGGYQDQLGIVGRREVIIKLRKEEEMGDF
ncbi:MAG: hypothetical protein QW212_00035 [Nitrososphaerales archaeon]